MIGGEHQDKPLPRIDRIEKPIIADTVSPRLRYGVAQFLHMRSDVGIRSQLRIDEGDEFALDAGLLAAEVLLKILLKLRAFENTELSQRACLCAAWRHGALPEVSP